MDEVISSFQERIRRIKVLWDRANTMRFMGNEYCRVLSSSSTIPFKVDAVAILCHGLFDPTSALSADLMVVLEGAAETEQRVTRAIIDLVGWSTKDGEAVAWPAVLLVGTDEQIDYMERVAQHYLADEYPSLHLPVARLVVEPQGMTTTQAQLHTLFRCIEDASWTSVAVYTSDYHVPRVEQLVQHHLAAKRQAGVWLDVTVEVLAVPWIADPKCMDETAADALMRDEVDRVIQAQREGRFPYL